MFQIIVFRSARWLFYLKINTFIGIHLTHSSESIETALAISLVIRRILPFQHKLKDLVPSSETDLDLLGLFWKEKIPIS